MTAPAFDVLSYGTIGLDQILRVPHFPRPDIGTHTLSAAMHLGGKATNTAAFLATWGLKVAISGHTIGDDTVGDELFERLKQYPHIGTDYLERKAGLKSMYCCILVTPDGERAIIGVNVEGNPQTRPTAEMIGDARLLTLDLYGGGERVEAARLAREAGIPVVIGDLRQSDHPVLPYATVAIASAAEIGSTRPALTPEAFARAVQAAGPAGVIVTSGAGDVLVYDGDKPVVALRPPDVPVVDTTGAGDSFRAGVVYGVLAGWALVACAALGTAAGSINVGREGGASNPPSLDEVVALMRQVRQEER
jgi:sugar/nucleoside kinase (ribokinase family)